MPSLLVPEPELGNESNFVAGCTGRPLPAPGQPGGRGETSGGGERPKLPGVLMKRVVVFLALVAACVVGYVFLIGLMKGTPHELDLILPALALAVAMFALNKRFFRLEGEQLAVIGFDSPCRRLRQFAPAFVAGCGVVLWWAMLFRWVLNPQWHLAGKVEPSDVVSRLAFFLFNNAAEELAYRGYLLWKLTRQY